MLPPGGFAMWVLVLLVDTDVVVSRVVLVDVKVNVVLVRDILVNIDAAIKWVVPAEIDQILLQELYLMYCTLGV